MNTKIIEYVIAIAEEKSINKAAERLYITQPALSQRLKALEDELGTPLFIRNSAGLSLTDAGRIYLNGGRSILQIKQNAMNRLAGMNRRSKDLLRFGCATSIALECIPAFREKYPQIELSTRRCTTPAAKEALIMGRMDMAVLLTSSLQHSALEYIPLSQTELLLAVPDGFPELTKEDIRQNLFQPLENDYFILSPPGSHSRDLEDKILHRMNIQPHILCEIGDNMSRRYMLNRKLGNGFLPDYSLQEDDLFHTYSLEPKIINYVVAAYPKTITLSDPMKYMLQLLFTIFDNRGKHT